MLRYIVSISPKGKFTVPIEIRKKLGLTPSTKLKVFVKEGKIIFKTLNQN